jgi:hypothetical protein
MALSVHECSPVRFHTASSAQRSSPCESLVEVGALVDGFHERGCPFGLWPHSITSSSPLRFGLGEGIQGEIELRVGAPCY